jgi:hypothetical protein
MRTATLLLALFAALPALAEPGAHREAARRFESADRAFRDGRYEDAVVDLEAAWTLEPRPELLVPLAQAYRALGQPDEALARCEQYLAVMPHGALAERVNDLARALRRESARHASNARPVVEIVEEPEQEADEPTRAEPAQPEPPRAPARPAPAPIAQPAPLPPVPAPAAPPPARTSKTTIALVATGVIAAVALALGVGLGVGLPANSAPSTRLGTVSFH